MTDQITIIDSQDDFTGFFADEDRAILEEVTLFALDEGINIAGLYCLHTGKMIGEFYTDELLCALRDESMHDDSIEVLADAMIVRCVASMRPSPAFNKPDYYTLKQISTQRPVDCIAYLINRLNGNRDLLVKRDGQNSLSPLIGRIATHRQWSALHAAGLDLTPWIHWLLELDSKMNLHDQTPPLVKIAPLHKPLFDMVTLENAAELLAVFEKWTFDRLAAYDKRDADMSREARWMRGNAMTRNAYVNSWLSNPELTAKKELARKPKKADSAKAGRPVSEKTKARRDDFASMLALLESTLADPAPTPTPAAAPAVVRAKPFGKLNLNRLLKKDS